MNPVVITGMGWVTPMGHSIETVWKRLLNGESGIARTTLFDASTFPTSISAEVKDCGGEYGEADRRYGVERRQRSARCDAECRRQQRIQPGRAKRGDRLPPRLNLRSAWKQCHRPRRRCLRYSEDLDFSRGKSGSSEYLRHPRHQTPTSPAQSGSEPPLTAYEFSA